VFVAKTVDKRRVPAAVKCLPFIVPPIFTC
jgi:hypothetical protein